MNEPDYFNISKNDTVEDFTNSSGAVGGGDSFGSGSVSNSHGPGSRSPSTNSQGGSKQYGSAGYASVSAITGSMSGLANRQPGSNSGLGIGPGGFGVVKPGAKTGTFTGGSFGGLGQYVIGFPGIKPGSNLPASSSPSLYIKPKLREVKSKFFDKETVQDVTLPYGHIDANSEPGIPGPRIGNKYDNVNHNRSTKLLGPKFPYGFDLRDKNLTGYYGYQGYGMFYDPFYWGLGPYYPITGEILNYPDVPYNYEDLMQKEVNADYMVNTIQNQLATQYMEEDLKKQAINNEEIEEQNEDAILKDPLNIKKSDIKEKFESGEQGQTCNKNTILIFLAVVLIIYILLTISMSDTEKQFNLQF
jgi:hypothetical protein